MARKLLKKGPKRSFPLDVMRKLVDEKIFILLVGFSLILSALVVNNKFLAMWLGFIFAAYSAIANDSIQTIGTFIESNRDKKWWLLWLFTGIIFLVTVTVSYVVYDGDVSYQRLDPEKYPLPEQFSYLQLIAPIVLLVLTRLKMPVSTTFLLLSSFSADSSGITSIFVKSVSSYGIAFVLSFVIWYAGYNTIKRYFKSRKSHILWTISQWLISGALWSVWLMQDAANIAVYLPRQLSLGEFIAFSGIIFVGLGLLFYLKGDKIQQVVNEKARISDVRAATLVDLSYVILLIYKTLDSTIPMSTTWVFLGIIGGREIAISLCRQKPGNEHKKKALRMIGKDALYATIGLVISILLALGVNTAIRNSIVEWFRGLI
jgi:hypothetical protein